SLFFFSSRRRHTRFSRDWSSDVCSSDLIYETFTQKAAEGRGMSLDDLKAVASGRVWSGVEAKQRGLVDVFGTLDDAVAIAAQAEIGRASCRESVWISVGAGA